MKRSLLLFYAVLLAMAAPMVPARAQSDDAVPIDFMYDALSPYGDWIYTPNYGYVWQPLAQQQPGWSPYSDGSWAFTDAGWTWISNEDFGWLTYHYGRWIRLMQGWVWVPGNQWAPAWVSWRQTQGQIGWAPLPPEAAWSPGAGFGGWTDSYYDIGPAYYNFVPIGMFASSGSLQPYILDRSRNFTFYDQSVNVTHTSYRPNVMNHIFVGGPDPRRIDGMGSNHVRRLTLRHDEEGFRRNWLDRQGGAPPRGAGSLSRIEQGQLVVAAPAFRRGASHALPSRVREPLQQPVVDRGWQGAADARGAERLRQQQRDELARTRPANLPDKTVLPATSTTPPPAFGRVLNPEERQGRGGHAVAGETLPPKTDPRSRAEDLPHTPATPKNPLPAGGPPGIPHRDAAEPGGTITHADRPRHERHEVSLPPGRRQGETNLPAPGDGGAKGRQELPQVPRHAEPVPPPAAVPQSSPPAASMQPRPQEHRQAQPPGNPAAGVQPGFPGHHPGPPQMQPPQRVPSPPAPPPHAAPAPMPPPQQPPPVHVQPPQGAAPPHLQPQAPQPPHPGGGRGKR